MGKDNVKRLEKEGSIVVGKEKRILGIKFWNEIKNIGELKEGQIKK